MDPDKEKFLKTLINQLKKKQAGLEKKITQAKKRTGKAESARTSWSDHTLTDIEDEISIFSQQLKTVQAQLKEIQGFQDQKVPLKKVVPGSLIGVDIDGEKQTLLIVRSPVGSFEQGLLSTQSPLGKTLVDKKANQSFTVSTPVEPLKVKLLRVV